VNARFSRNIVPLLAEQQLMYVLVDLICTADVEPTQLPPFHLCLVIDRSTSMQGPRMDMVKASASMLLKQFRPHDLLSVVAFSDRAEVVIAPTRLTDVAREDARISMLNAGGGTEIYQGLLLGVEQLRSMDTKYSRQLVILTDGHTYGDDEACLELANQLVQDGITVSCLGIGHEWNDALLDKIASISGGGALFVSSPKDLNKFIDQKLTQLGTTYARNLSFEFSSDTDVKLRYAFRLHPEAGMVETSSPIQLGNLQYRKSMSFLLEFMVPPQDASAQMLRLALGQIKMEIPSIQSTRARVMIDLSRPVAVNPERESPPSVIVEAMAKLTLYRMQDRVRKEVTDGQIDKATKHLHYLATHLLSHGDRELAHTVLIEAEHIQQSRRFSKEGDKRIKYGTRALLLPPGPEQKP
jgi:Ca-activated chloride channel family protein